ncbi:MAG: hypothetical protein SOU84_06550 [Candidatus Faecimonas sp.]|nr:hypothetical protein [Candidatus Faecimonas sp.]
MTENLINLLKDAINDKKKAVKEYNNHLDKNLSNKIEVLENLRKDINEITKIEMSMLNEMVDSFQISDKDKDDMKKELDIIKALLTLNQKEKTNYTLLPSQLTTISAFLDNLETYIEEKNIEKQAIDPEYKNIIMITNKYKDLLYKIKDPNTNELIMDVDTILQLFQDTKITEEEKQMILLTLIKYNQEVMHEKENNHQKKRVTIKELTAIFSRYGYSFSKLDKKYQDQLKKYGTLKNIEDVLSIMQKLEFPKIDEKEEGLLLVTYLIATNKDALEEVTAFAQERGINLTELKNLVCAFIANDYLYNNKHRIGRKDDFRKNISLLVEHGISIPAIINKGKDLLIINNEKLQNNLNWLECYGLYSSMQEESLLDDIITALKSQNIPEVIDLWLENHQLGLQYIKNNLSILASHMSNQAILFYKLYKSEKENKNDAFRLTVSNGIKKLSLRKEMTHNNIDYQGIHDKESALTVTRHQKPIFAKEKEYEQAAKKSLHNKISDDIFTREEIVSLNRFSDLKETLLYDINGLKISKLKVLRIYDALCKNNLGGTLESLLYSICYNKIITKEEYEKLIIDMKQTVTWKEV